MRTNIKQVPTFLGVSIVAMVILTACSTAIQPNTAVAPAGQNDAVAPDTGDKSTGSSSTALQLPADFAVTLYQGEEVFGAEEFDFSTSFSQGKPVVLNLWAGLCPPCRLEMPDFQEVYVEFGDEILMLGLDVGSFTNLGSSEDAQALIQELGVTYPVGTTNDAQVVRDYGLIGMPTTYFIKPNGELHQQWTGLLTEAKLAELVQELIDVSNVTLEGS
jgi:thiol-disulfide isomerase/thioredoxin